MVFTVNLISDRHHYQVVTVISIVNDPYRYVANDVWLHTIQNWNKSDIKSYGYTFIFMLKILH